MTQFEFDLLLNKVEISKLIGALIDRAVDRGMVDGQIGQVTRRLSAEFLELAARMHDGSDASFVQMARRSLALVRTGAAEQ